VFATVHGVIPVEEGEPRLFRVPEGIKITRVMATRPGVCNVTQEDQINTILNDMKKTFKTITPDEINTIVASIKPGTLEVVKNLVRDEKNTDTDNKALFRQFVRSHIKTPTVKEFLPGQEIIDKFLARSIEESMESAYDFKLNIVNMPGNPDLFDWLLTGRLGPSASTREAAKIERDIFLSEMVEKLHTVGVRHIVLFDFTCSSFDSVLSDREERAVRRSMTGVGRRRTRRRKNKTKTRRGKKRTSLWNH